MIFPTKGEICQRLIHDFGYSEYEAQATSEQFRDMSASLRPAFAKWWRDGIIPDLSVEGYTIRSLVEEQGLQLPGAFAALDWLLKDPKEARNGLERGYDTVTEDSCD